MPSRAEAEEALYGAIISCAESAAEKKDSSLLKTVAESFGEVAHGPQGGDQHFTRIAKDEQKTETAYRYTSSTDYHETHHPDGEPRHPPGFSARDGSEDATREMPQEHHLPRSG